MYVEAVEQAFGGIVCTHHALWVNYTEIRCEYPDGTRVLGAENLEVRDGRMIRQVSIEAWDE